MPRFDQFAPMDDFATFALPFFIVLSYFFLPWIVGVCAPLKSLGGGGAHSPGPPDSTICGIGMKHTLPTPSWATA